jgi:hypothetical protein
MFRRYVDVCVWEVLFQAPVRLAAVEPVNPMIHEGYDSSVNGDFHWLKLIVGLIIADLL